MSSARKAAEKIRVLVVDDSAVVRQTFAELLAGDPEIELMATASDPFVAAQRISREVPNVIILDVEMPRMDGLTFLSRIMAQHPMPVIICSSLAQRNTETALKALESGAVEVIAKPRVGTRVFLEESREMLRDAIKAAAGARLRRSSAKAEISPKLSADAVIAAPAGRPMLETTEKVVLIGASTGGTEAIAAILQRLPLNAPGIVVVQHMPEKFTAAFADRLNRICGIEVKEAENQDTVLRGRALIAPGNHHLLLKRSGARYYVEVKDAPLVNRHRPSVDVLFRSGARYAGKNALGILLTGMGDDGARGLLEMKEGGAMTIAQDENSCVVFGMPHEAIKLGAAGRVLPLDAIPEALLSCTSAMEAAR